MEVILASPRGFCAGVVRAIDIVDLCLQKFGPPVYVKHEIVHNPYVVRSLESKGAVTVHDLSLIPKGAPVVFSAHGSPPEDFKEAQSRGLRVIDATCPLVTKVHNEAKKYHREGKRIILVGHSGHAEVRGTMGQAPAYLMDGNEATPLPPWEKDVPVAVLTQTTLSVDDTAKIVSNIRSRHPKALVRNDVCYATSNRQEAVKRLIQIVDIVLVIGSQSSSNCTQLREVARERGVPAHLIDSDSELEPRWFDGVEKIGITSGASTPDLLVNNVISRLKPDKVSTITSIMEDVEFVLPKELG